MTAYLESLSTRAYFVLYGCRDPLWRQIGGFFTHGWPTAVRGIVGETLLIAALFFACALAGYFLVAGDPAWFNALVPAEMAGGRDMNATAQYLRSTLYDAPDQGGLEVFATYLFTHNAQISILAFALGFAFAIPTFFLIASNGVLLTTKTNVSVATRVKVTVTAVEHTRSTVLAQRVCHGRSLPHVPERSTAMNINGRL